MFDAVRTELAFDLGREERFSLVGLVGFEHASGRHCHDAYLTTGRWMIAHGICLRGRQKVDVCVLIG